MAVTRLSEGPLPGLPVQSWNQMARATELVQSSNLGEQVFGDGVPDLFRNFLPVMVETPTLEADGKRSRGEILGVGDVVLEPVDDNAMAETIRIKGISPVAGDRFVVLQSSTDENTPDNPAAMMGLTWAKVNIIDAADTTCGIEDGVYVLKSGLRGTRIVWKPSGTGEKLCLIILGESCLSLMSVFVPSGYSPASDVVAVVPKWNVIDGEVDGCSYEEVKNCPAAAPLQTTYDTEVDLVAAIDPTDYPSGTQFYVVDDDDPDNLVSDVYIVQGPEGGLGTAFQRVGGLTPLEERQLAFWAVNQ